MTSTDPAAVPSRKGASVTSTDPAAVPSRMRLRIVATLIGGAMLAAGCGASGASPEPAGPSVVVTTSVLGSVVRELVGDGARVTVLMGNGVDPHDWSPSAKDLEALTKADLAVANGLGLEGGFEKTLDEARQSGVVLVRATDYIEMRRVDGVAESTPDGHTSAAGDPHFWVDPIAMRAVVGALADALGGIGVDVADQAADFQQRLTDLDTEARGILASVPDSSRKLVTGHESMGYFADRYDFVMIGTIIPGLSSQGEVSAGELAALKAEIDDQGVRAIFAEIGTPAAVTEAIARETGARVVELPSHTIPPDGSYFTFIRQIATTVADALQ